MQSFREGDAMADGLVCDACNETLIVDSTVRYVVKIEGFAAYDPLELTREDLDQDWHAAMKRTVEELEKVDSTTAQNQVHRSFQFDLCPVCWRRYLNDPLSGVRQH